MQNNTNPLFESYFLTADEIQIAKEHLAEPIVQAYIRSIVSGELSSFILNDLYSDYSAGSDIDMLNAKILMDNAFNRGMLALAKQLVIISGS